MKRIPVNKSSWLAWGLLAFLACTSCGGKKNANAKVAPVDSNSAEPDKLLYTKGTDDIKHGRITVGRLELQTLLNTYPDSEYQAKAKLAIADSYYKEGGATALTQSVAEYQDFITFFPFLDEAAYAQSQVGMAHFRAMEKPDRDRAEALDAEGAFQTFLQKYPDNPMRPQVEQHLREVQEILAEGDFGIANFYYIRGAFRPSALRLAELVDRYPLFSQADRANWMLGGIYERSEHNEVAAPFYARIVKNYPLSPLADDAKAKLMKFGFPVPQPDPAALARMQTEQNTPRVRPSLISKPLGMLKSGPNLRMAARTGEPTLTPPPDSNSQPLTPGANPTIAGPVSGAPTAGGGTGAFIETVTPGSSASGTAAGTATAAPSGATPATGDSSQPAAQGDASQTPAASTAAPSTTTAPQSESSSVKKKKGLRKLIPF